MVFAWCVPVQAFQADVGRTFTLVDELANAGNYREAALVLEEALPDQGRIQEAALRVRLAEVLRQLKRSEQAFSELERAEMLLKSTTYERQLRCLLLAERGLLYIRQGLLDVSIDPLARARQQLEELEAGGDDSSRERIKLDLVEALLLRSQQDWDGLQAHVERALEHEVYEYQARAAAILESRLARALVEPARDDPSLAERARRAVEPVYALEQVQPAVLIEPDLVLAELDLREGSWRSAREHLDRADERLGHVNKRLQNPLGPWWYALHSRWVQNRRDPSATSEELVQLRDDLRYALGKVVEGWRQLPLRAGGYGLQRYVDQRGLISELMRVEMKLAHESRGVERALSHLMSAEDAGTLVRRMTSQPTSLQRVRGHLLGPDGADAVLVYFAGADDNHVFVVERTEVGHVRLEHDDHIEKARHEAVRSLRKPLGDAPDWIYESRAKALAGLAEMVLPSELRERLAGRRRLTIVGAQDVPFEALPYGDTFFGAQFAIDYAPSLALGALLAERAAEATHRGRFVVGGAPPHLPFETSRSNLERLIPAHRKRVSRALFGDELTFGRLQVELQDCDVWTLLTHGRRDENRERSTVVALAGNTENPVWVGAREFERLDAPAIVAFAICGSERGPQRWGDQGSSTLAGALFAGSRTHCVVQSSFDLDESAAVNMFGQWHEELERGMSPAEALRRVRERCVRSELLADPFYHGVIRVVGFGQRPLGRH